MKKVLFVCTGNTCRSPMAECLFNAYAEEKGLPYRAISAGVFAHEGSPASDGAYAAMKARGLSLKGHRAQPLSAVPLSDVSLIVAMSPQHVALVNERFPTLSVPVRTFAPAIPDPYGGSVQAYQHTANALDKQIVTLANELAKPKDKGI